MAVALLIATSPIQAADESLPAPIGNDIIVLHGVAGSGVRVFDQPRRPENVLIFPVFAFAPAEDGHSVLITEVADGSRPGYKVLSIELQINPPAILELIATRLKAEASKMAADAKNKSTLENITASRVVPVRIKELTIEEVTVGANPKFEPFVQAFVGGSSIKLSVRVPDADVVRVKQEITDGHRTFAIRNMMWATAEAGSTTATITYEQLLAVEAVANIVGDVNANDWRAVALTRDQVVQLRDKISDRILVQYNVVGASDADLDRVEKVVDGFLHAAFKNGVLLADDDAAWKKVRMYSFDRGDITPAKIQQFIKKTHDDIKDKKETQIDASMKAEADVAGVLGASADNKFSGKWLKDHAEEHNLELEIQGDIGIPIGLKVQQADKAELSRKGALDTVIIRSFYTVNPDINQLSTKTTPGNLDRIAALETSLLKLRSDTVHAFESLQPFTFGQADVEHGYVVKPPEGTKTSDWHIIVTVKVMGFKEPEEHDNAMLGFDAFAREEPESNQWLIDATTRFRKGATDDPKGKVTLNGRVGYLLVRKNSAVMPKS